MRALRRELRYNWRLISEEVKDELEEAGLLDYQLTLCVMLLVICLARVLDFGPPY